MRCKRIESEKQSKNRSKQVYSFGGSVTTRLVPVLTVVVVPEPRAVLLAVAPVTPGRGLVLGSEGFVVVLLLVVPRLPPDGGGLVGDVGGLGFCRFVIVFSLSSPAAAAVRVLMVGLAGTFSCGLLPVSFALPLSLAAVVVVPGFLTSTFAFVLSVADVVVGFLVVAGFTFLGDMGVFLAFKGGSGSTSIEIPNSSSNVISFSTSLPFAKSSKGLAQSSSIKVASGALFSTEVSTAIESNGSLGFPEETAGSSRGGDALSNTRTRLRGLGLTGEYA